LKKILIIDTYYEGMINHIKNFSEKYTDAQFPNYQEIFEKGFFGTGASYAHYLSILGYKTKLLVANFQTKENQFNSYLWSSAYHQSRVPLLDNFLTLTSPIHKNIYYEAVRYKPDIIIVHDINLIPKNFARALKGLNIKLVGEIASPLPPLTFFENFDLVVSSLPSIVNQLDNLSINSKFLPLGFDPRLLQYLTNPNKEIDVVFVGSFSKYHSKNIPLLKSISKVVNNFKIYGVDRHNSIGRSGLNEYYAGEAWGIDMFSALKKSRIIINRHIDMAGDYAANMRMFESTGVGSLLLTDKKSNLSQYFDITNEVIVYEDFDDAAEKIKTLLNNPGLLERVASAGQGRTLRDHTYSKRIENLHGFISELF